MSVLDKIKENKQENNEQNTVQDTKTVQPLTQPTPPKPKEYLWSCKTSDTFSVHLPSGEIRCKDGLARLNQVQHRELLALIATGRPDISQNIQYLDVEEAEKIAAEHLAAKRKMAGRGSLNSGMPDGGLREIKAKNGDEGMSPEAKAKFEASAAAVLANAQEEEIHHADDSTLQPVVEK